MASEDSTWGWKIQNGVGRFNMGLEDPAWVGRFRMGLEDQKIGLEFSKWVLGDSMRSCEVHTEV